MRDSLRPCPQWSPLSNSVGEVDNGLSRTAATCTRSLVTELGRGDAEKLTMMIERNEQNGRIVSIASENML